MLQIESIKLVNFGPFKGRQTIEFPDEDGVTVVFGENMRGKTMLLNSIRYALFGRILSRGSREGTREISPEQVVNWESQEEGNHSFKVILEFEYENDEYELNRAYEPKDGVTEPRGDSDYTEEVFLRKNGSVLGPEEKDRELNRIMPQQVSRFFLFDGELLQQYEELLVDESDMGRQIREAIERILGLPVLTNGRADLQELLEDAQRKESEAAQRDNKTEELGNQLENLTEKRSHHKDELESLTNEVNELKERRSSIQEKRKEQEAIRGYVEDKEKLEEEVKGIEEEIQEKEEKLRDLMSDSWKGVLNETISEKLSELRDRRRKLIAKRSDERVAEKLAERLEEAIDEDSRCPICSQNLDEESENHLEEEIKTLREVEDNSEDVEQEYHEVNRSIDILESLESPDPGERVEEIVSEIDRLKAERAEKKDTIGDIDERINTSEEEEVNRLNRKYDQVVREIQVNEDAKSETEEKIEEANKNIKKLQKQLDQASGHEFDKDRRRRELFDDLYELFDEGVDVYREKLREQVEADATRIFLNLTTEPEYSGLKINDNYGLTILHEDGDEIPVRSAGAEHVVALSLMGALQNNAPLQGPIIMDSPFGRLDEGHVSNVVEALPSITDQVVLLVYRSELSPELARDLLKGKLRSEYSLQRVSARHTKLVPGGGQNE